MPSYESFTPQQLDTGLAAVLKTVAPTEAKLPSALERLMKFRRVFQKYRKKGYSSQQIAEALRHPSIGLDASPSLVRKAALGLRPKPAAPIKFEAIFPDEAKETADQTLKS